MEYSKRTLVGRYMLTQVIGTSKNSFPKMGEASQ